jgi:HEAT repeat protein
MQVAFSREQAADLLLGRATLAPEAFSSTPVVMRRRTAFRAAVQVLAESTRLSAMELGALLHAATTDSDPHVRASAVMGLAQAAAPALAAPLLIASSADLDARVREAAQQGLEQLEKDGARVVPLLRAVNTAEPAVAKEPAFIGH